MRRALVVACLVYAQMLFAQRPEGTAASRAAHDSLISRARKLSDAGNTADARRLVDSVLKVASQESPAYAEALYLRAALANVAVDAERDYRRLLVEAPLSARAEDAMLQLAQLEQARGDRRAATEHFQRFVLSYANNPARPRAAISLVRLLFEQGLTARGCDAMRTAQEAVPLANLELRNQLEFYAPRCVDFTTAPPSAADSSSAAKDSTRSADPASPTIADTAAPPPKPVTAPPSTAKSDAAFYSVQVAAYDASQPAIRMARMLKTRGLESRVDGTTRPFRVRVGRYNTRAEAVKAAAALKSQGIAGFVTLVKK
jgi:cell division septation protein DedD